MAAGMDVYARKNLGDNKWRKVVEEKEKIEKLNLVSLTMLRTHT